MSEWNGELNKTEDCPSHRVSFISVVSFHHITTEIHVRRCTPGGIGYAVATEFQSRGYHVIATARKPSLLDEFRSKEMDAVPLDVTNAASIATCREEVGRLCNGKLDILVNNA